ncbi:MAG TPA: PAS domain S-box protein [Candidatus Acidoferrum sp.]|nr:PAS domain S-box protein [Candidatus Acidoferrum sp.]
MISANAALPGSYDYGEVARSVLIAIAASYAGLDLAGRVTAARGRISLGWLSGGAIAMGIGIWEMHFKGMMAFHLPVSVAYHWPTVLAALLVAMLASAVALSLASGREMGWVEAVTGSIFMGAGIAGLHYLLMAAMRLPAITRYSPLLVVCSILLAVLFSLIALLLAFGLREETRWAAPRRVGSATVMGAAISAMHYTGMAAASFIPTSPPDLSHAVNISPLGNNGIAVVTLIVIVGAIVTSSVDRRVSAEIQRLNQDLERRVAERTLQFEALNHALRREIAERERAEEDVRRSEERLRLVIDTTPAMLYSARPDGYVDFFNKRWLQYVGVSLDDLLGWQWTDVIHPDDLAQLVDKWHTSVATGKPFEAEARLRRADGEYRLMLLRKVPLPDEAGSIVKWYGSAIDIEERKRAEQELRQAEEHIRAILEYSPNWIFLKDTEGRYLLVNREIERVFGISQEQIKGKTDSEISPPEQAAEYRANDLKVLRAGLTMEFEEIALLEDGPHTSIVHKFPLFDTHGNIYAIGGVATDITERKRAEEALRTSERRQHKIAKQLEAERARLIEAQAVAKVGSWETEWPSLEVSWSEQTHRIFETDPSHFHPSRPDFVEFIHPEDRAKVDAAFQASLDKRAPSNVEYRIVMADGRVKVLEEQWRVFHDEQGRPIRLMGTCRDITERKRAEAELRESEARFRLVADSAPVMIWMSATDKLCTYFNKPWLDFTGRSLEQEIGNGWAEGVHPEDLRRCMATYLRSFDRREAFTMEYRLRRHDGEFRLVYDIGVPRFNPDGSFAGYIGSCIDVTEQRRAEEQLRQTRDDLARVTRAQAMGELAAAIAHEVNQPLTAIVTNANYSLRQLKGSNPNLDELRAAITEIVNDGTRASDVISRIRGLLTKGSPRRAQLDINEIIQQVITLLRNELDRNRVYLRTQLAADLARVQGDPVELQQVLINLIMNALEAMRAGTKQPRKLLIKSTRNHDGVLVQVQDSGPGIEPELASRVFEPFFTTKPEGTGMGLAISRSIVESHGGELSLVADTRGALFQFVLPVDRSDAA